MQDSALAGISAADHDIEARIGQPIEAFDASESVYVETLDSRMVSHCPPAPSLPSNVRASLHLAKAVSANADYFFGGCFSYWQHCVCSFVRSMKVMDATVLTTSMSWLGAGMLDPLDRKEITHFFGKAIDEIVRELYSDALAGISTAQEPEITSRICQGAEDRLNGRTVGHHRLRVSARSMPDRGPKSVERKTGADLYLSVSLDGEDGFNKGLLIQAKYDRHSNREELIESCEKMAAKFGETSAYVWVYKPNGVYVLSPEQLRNSDETLATNIPGARRMSGFAGRILDCYAGNKTHGIRRGPNRKQQIDNLIRELHADNALDVSIEKD
jgi:hypothetical protein